MYIAAIFAPTKSETSKPKMDNLVINLLDFLCKSSFTKHPALTKNDKTEGRNPTKVPLPARSLNQTTAAAIDVDSAIWSDPATPDCFITKVVEPISNMTAPAMHTLKKVKPRRCKLVSKEEEEYYTNEPACTLLQRGFYAEMKSSKAVYPTLINNTNNLHDNKFSPVGRINLTYSPCNEICTVNFKMKRVSFQYPGSKKDPITIAKCSPKPPMDCTVKNIQTVGSNDFRRRCNKLAKKADTT